MGFRICQKVWCGKCYTSSDDDRSFIADSDESMMDVDDDKDRLLSGWNYTKRNQNRFRFARNGDDLLISFECDWCMFHKLFRRSPSSSSRTLISEQDAFAVTCIRQINLDAFWSRAPSTVSSNAAKIREGLAISERLGLTGPYLAPGPLPPFDHCGYEVALQMVVALLKAGRYASSHKRWDTIRGLRSAYSNQVRSSRIANQMCLSLADGKGASYNHLSVEPCGSLWFQRFMTGCRKRMGQDWRPNRAISNPLMNELLTGVETKVKDCLTLDEQERWLLAGGYFCICYDLSLRSPGGLMVDLEGLHQFNPPGRPTTIVTLLGRVKGEHHSRQHLLTSVNVTDSGINVHQWVQGILTVHRFHLREKGPAFISPEENQATTSEMNEMFLEVLSDIFEAQPDLFSPDIKNAADLGDKYNVFRSFRRGSESRAVAQKLSEADRYIASPPMEEIGNGRCQSRQSSNRPTLR